MNNVSDVLREFTDNKGLDTYRMAGIITRLRRDVEVKSNEITELKHENRDLKAKLTATNSVVY